MKLFILLFTWFMGGSPMGPPESAQMVHPAHQPLDANGQGVHNIHNTTVSTYVSGDPERLRQTLVIFEDTHFRIRN